MHMNRNRRTSREAIDSILPISDLNRLESDFQYLEKETNKAMAKRIINENVHGDRDAKINQKHNSYRDAVVAFHAITASIQCIFSDILVNTFQFLFICNTSI